MKFSDARIVAAATAAVVLTLVAGQTVPAVAAPTPSPTPSPSASDPAAAAKDKLKQLEDQASAIGEQYDTVSDALDAGKAKLKVLQDDIALQQKKVDELSAAAQTIALAQFRNRDFDTTVQIFTSSDPDSLLDRLSTASRVDETMNSTLSEQQAAQANLDDMQRSAQAEVAALADQEKQLADLKKQIQGKVNAADQVYKSLSGQDQQAVDGGTTTSDPGDYADADARIKTAISYALSKVGKAQYVWGADGPSGYDCSGLMLASYRAAGISLPHSSRTMSTMGMAVSKSDLKPGDLIFFYNPVHHVGMYIGGGKFVHARNTRVDLVVQTLASYPAPWAGARRIIR